MQLLDNFIILTLIIGSFVAGLKLANWYNAKASAEQKYALEKQFVRLQAGSDADDPVQPYVPPNPIPVEFMDHLRANGRATMQFDKSNLS